MSSPNNNSIVVGGPRRPAPRRSNASQAIPDSEESDVDMDAGSNSTIDQPIDTSVMAKNAVAFSAAPTDIAVIPDTVAPEVNTSNQTNGADKSLVVTEPRALPVHPKSVPGPIAKTSTTQNLSIEEITLRQLQEDMEAYEKDQNFCAALLDEETLTPQETRTIKIRQFDLMHQARATRHRIELLTIKTGPGRGRPAKITAATSSLAASASAYRATANIGPSSAAATTNGYHTTTAQNTNTPAPGSPSKPKTAGTKRASLHHIDGDDASPSDGDASAIKDDSDDHTDKRPRIAPRMALTAAPADSAPSEFRRYEVVTRLGYWMCRLCLSPKFMSAGAGRHPAMPCKWALRDTSKLVGHHVNLHHEHTRAERCAELAVALDHNRGPLEYWLTTTKSFDIGDGTVINEIIDELKAARIHPVLRQLNRAAREMEEE